MAQEGYFIRSYVILHNAADHYSYVSTHNLHG